MKKLIIASMMALLLALATVSLALARCVASSEEPSPFDIAYTMPVVNKAQGTPYLEWEAL